MAIEYAISGGKELSIDGSDGSGGQFLTSEWLYGQTGCRRGSKSRKKGHMVKQYLQETNADGASAYLRRRWIKQGERQEEELQFDMSNA